MTDVIMPQMGESIAEGTVTKWLKNVGDKVQRDEPLFEISTDKVDAEIPAPASGVLMEIRVQPGSTVAINTVVGVIGGEGEVVAPPRRRRRTPQRRGPRATAASLSRAATPAAGPPRRHRRASTRSGPGAGLPASTTCPRPRFRRPPSGSPHRASPPADRTPPPPPPTKPTATGRIRAGRADPAACGVRPVATATPGLGAHRGTGIRAVAEPPRSEMTADELRQTALLARRS